MLERATRANLLYDFYGPLLSEKQRELFELYYHDDLSLGEIAETHDISRQGIYDNIKRTEKTLEDFESKLQLYDKYLVRESVYMQLIQQITTTAMSVEERQACMQLIEMLQMNE